jgi:hypothetical protein
VELSGSGSRASRKAVLAGLDKDGPALAALTIVVAVARPAVCLKQRIYVPGFHPEECGEDEAEGASNWLRTEAGCFRIT